MEKEHHEEQSVDLEILSKAIEETTGESSIDEMM